MGGKQLSQSTTELFNSLMSAHGVAVGETAERKRTIHHAALLKCADQEMSCISHPSMQMGSRNTRGQGLGLRGPHVPPGRRHPLDPPPLPVPHLLVLQARPALPPVTWPWVSSPMA